MTKEAASQEDGPAPVRLCTLKDAGPIALPGGESLLLKGGEEALLPAPYAQALVSKGLAEILDGTGPEQRDAKAGDKGESIIPWQLRDARYRFVRLGRGENGKKPIDAGWQKDRNYAWDAPELTEHIERGYNYGELCGPGDLRVIDADDPEVVAAIEASPISETMVVKSGRDGGGGHHYILRCSGLRETVPLGRGGDMKQNVGHIKSYGGQAVGTGSVHPTTGRRYEIIRDLPIAEVAEEQVLDALRPFLKSAKVVKAAAPSRRKGELRVDDVFDIADFKAVGEERRGPHPVHGSTTGDNLAVNVEKNVWKCWRCDSGGDALMAVAVREGIIPCENARPGCLDDPQVFDSTMAAAREKYGLTVAEDEERERPRGEAEALIELALHGTQAEFFHDASKAPFARLACGDHYEVKAVTEADFEMWLKYEAYRARGRAPRKDALAQAIDTVAVVAICEGEEREVFIRRGEAHGAFYYDLCDRNWRAVRITSQGWEIVDEPPVMFRRFDHMLPQVVPQRGRKGAIREIAAMVNTSPEMQRLLEFHLVTLLVPNIPHYNGFFLGPQGCTKSTGTSMCKNFVDPGTDDREALPMKGNDLDLHLATRALASYDNASRITADGSDALARASTGSGSTRRALYTNNGQVIRKYRTPFVLNAIALDGGIQPDLLDRSIVYACEPVMEDRRMTETSVRARYDELLPYALGEAFDALSKAMRIREAIASREGWAPRMKDAYLWMMAIAKALGTDEDEFEALFKRVVQQRDSDALEGNPLATALEFVARNRGFVGTATQLYDYLNDVECNIPFLCNIDPADRQWPTSGISLGKRLPRIIAPLRNRGVFIYQCHRNELDDQFGTLRDLGWARGLDAYDDASRMIIIADHEVRRDASDNRTKEA